MEIIVTEHVYLLKNQYIAERGKLSKLTVEKLLKKIYFKKFTKFIFYYKKIFCYNSHVKLFKKIC